eukprot:12462569-Alexandrium_andersonii.AAC.1
MAGEPVAWRRNGLDGRLRPRRPSGESAGPEHAESHRPEGGPGWAWLRAPCLGGRSPHRRRR